MGRDTAEHIETMRYRLGPRSKPQLRAQGADMSQQTQAGTQDIEQLCDPN